MPELPEVESVRRQLEPGLVGRRFERVEIADPRLVRPYDPDEVAAELQGERVAAVERRGKYLIVRFDSGRVLLVHLRMTGSLLHAPRGTLEDDPHRRVVVKLDDGSDVAYRDVRRFGTWLLLEPGEADAYVDERVGVEPLEAVFTAAHLAGRLARRRAPIKAALLDQRTLAGMGNIYVDEALWRARLNPLRPAASIDRNEVRRLHKGIREALAHGIARQGSTLRDYRLPDGGMGAMQDEFRAYGRGGEPCDRCATPIAKTRVAGRGTWYCPRCQPVDPAEAQAASSSSSRPSRSSRRSSA
ncbi:MAG TPA: bifunctional DNA-formamidopyrimidine glycosylase/DNA-(apurinic or apyrimidinic site) lyase [Gaiellaceae bacterium]|nr:bifunctional DNA-formamidopyrimidine glycosylase/DNA-(apurinic or apyrimidinic site) lyase [Gaiellaceae bacterium]